MKNGRLDQFLLKSGKVSEEQLCKALLRQKSRGGKLGTHLLYYGFFSEDDLARALSEQFQVPAVHLSSLEIPPETVKKLPVGVAEEFAALPFRFDRATGELHVAIADPENPNALAAIRRASATPKVLLYVAPEHVLKQEIARYYHGRERSSAANRAVDLPELFEEVRAPTGAPSGETPGSGADAAGTHVLLFTRQEYLKNVLPSLLERERLSLSVATSAAEALECAKATRCSRVLVSEESREEFERLAAAPENAGVFPEVSYFRTVGSSLLDNPVPYDRMFDCLFLALQIAASGRGPDAWQAPLALISRDIAEVGRILGLGRIVVDGLQIAACLLVPAPPREKPDDAGNPARELFADMDTSVQAARQLGFPWDVAGCLQALRSAPAGGGMSVPSGLLALVWYRHLALATLRAGPLGETETLKTRLRGQVGRMAPSSVVESYIRVLEQTDHAPGVGQDVFVAGEGDPLPPGLLFELRNHGFRIVEAENFQDARKIFLRRRPAAILVHVDRSREGADGFCRYLREELSDAETVLFALTRRNEPSFLLNLMDTWFNDVLPMPMDSAVAVARISRALTAREKGAGVPAGKGFSATFKDLPFLDLMQTLGSSGRNARMILENPGGRRAEIYVREGKIVFATDGETTGAATVYEVIRWQAEGSFRVEPAASFPPDNVTLPTDFILLEGLRLLDEGLAGRRK